ncbi:MAG: hypothetical protein JSS65_08215 [Armatimonadetes bacterium]|nr:hypothetical protein [Armatimonadota bacterium]
MKVHVFLLSAASLVCALAGCGGPNVEIKGENGETVKIDGKGGVEVKDKNGTTAMSSADGKVTATDAKGNTATVEGKDGSMKVDGPDGKMEMSKDAVKESELGLPFYPGSTSVNAQKSEANGKSQFLCIRQTKDDAKKVAEFYISKFKVESNASTGTDGNDMVVLGGKLADGRKVALNVTQNKGEETTISIVVGQE